jgi:hypothetical protein
MEDARIDAKPYSIAMPLAFPGRFDTLGKAGRAKLMLLDHPAAVQAPGYNGLIVRLDSKQVVDIAAFGKQNQITA